MTTTEIVDLLSAHQTVGSAPREELEWLAAHGTLRTFAEGDVMTHKGATRVDGMFIILSGHIAIFVDRGGGPRQGDGVARRRRDRHASLFAHGQRRRAIR